MFYFTLWFPQRERAKVIAFFMLALPVSTFFSSPISGWILDNLNWMGLSGWRWLFFLEGLPAVLFGAITWFYLTDSPKDAKWLSNDEKQWLITEMERENANKSGSGKKHIKFRVMFSDRRVWRVAVIYLFMSMSAAIMAAWGAIIIKDFAKVSNTQVGLLGMLPPMFAIIVMPLWAWHSDKTGERKIHAVISLVVAFTGVTMTAIGSSPVIKMIGLVFFWVGSTSVMGPFWTIPTLFLTGASAAIGTAVINSCNAFGGFFATFISGFIQSEYGFTGMLLFVCMCYLAAILMTATLPLKHQKTARMGMKEGEVTKLTEYGHSSASQE
jgi:ACS family tartrate transporter-like MFS transporter